MRRPIERWNAAAAIWLMLSLLAPSPIAAAPEESTEVAPRIAVVTHLENETASITRAELARMFRKTQTEWSDGERCIPIDQVGGSEIRKEFGRIVLQETPDAWKRYWIQQTMTGNARPPISLDSSETVKKYVQKLRGAVAYIHESEVDETVRVLAISDAPELLEPAVPEEAKGEKEEVRATPSGESLAPEGESTEAPK